MSPDKISINVKEFAKLLASSGWKRIQLWNRSAAIYKKEEGDRLWQVTLPETTEFRDYDEVILKAISEYADSEGISREEALLTAQYPNSDIIYLRTNDNRTQAGSITMDAAVRIYDNAKKLFIATAMDIINPKTEHKGRQPQKVSSFINNCRFGQTEIGSYIIPVVCPLQNLDDASDNAEQLSLFSDEDDLSDSFTRKVTAKLMDNLGIISDCINNDGDIEALANRPADSVISINFIEALKELNDIDNDAAALDFHISWAHRAPENRSKVQAASFSRNMTPILEAASRRLSEHVKPDISIIGRIKALKSTPDAAERKNGKAEIVYLDDADRKKTSRIILGKEDYDLAIEAHRRGLLVKVEGKTSAESENTYNAISISILEA